MLAGDEDATDALAQKFTPEACNLLVAGAQPSTLEVSTMVISLVVGILNPTVDE